MGMFVLMLIFSFLSKHQRKVRCSAQQQCVCHAFMKINGVWGGGVCGGGGGESPLSIHLAQSKWQVQALVHE